MILSEVIWCFDLGIVPPHKKGFRFTVKQRFDTVFKDCELKGVGEYETMCQVLPVAFGKWLDLGDTWTYGHKTFDQALFGKERSVQLIERMRFDR